MIREFEKKDLENFEPNEFSSPENIKFVFDDDAWWLYVIENKGIKAIIAWKEAEDNEWGIFALVSKHFTARDSVEMRTFGHRAEKILKPKKVWTCSLPIAITDKWHKFLGFTFDEEVEHQGTTYNRWIRI
jgi:hypothetical protein